MRCTSTCSPRPTTGFSRRDLDAKAHPQVVARGLALQALGNDILARSAPLGAPGERARRGFSAARSARSQCCARASRRRCPKPSAARLDRAPALHRRTGLRLCRPAPSRRVPDERRCIVSDRGLDLGAELFETRFQETQVPHSTALHAALDGALISSPARAPELTSTGCRHPWPRDRPHRPAAAEPQHVQSIVARAEILSAARGAPRAPDYTAPIPPGR